MLAERIDDMAPPGFDEIGPELSELDQDKDRIRVLFSHRQSNPTRACNTWTWGANHGLRGNSMHRVRAVDLQLGAVTSDRAHLISAFGANVGALELSRRWIDRCLPLARFDVGRVVHAGGATVRELKVDPWDQPVSEIRELEDGWNGPGTIAPSDRAKRELLDALALLRPIEVIPEFSVDEDDGEITLNWSKRGDTAFLALKFAGNGKMAVLARGSDGRRVRSDVIDLSDAGSISGVVRMATVQHLLRPQ